MPTPKNILFILTAVFIYCDTAKCQTTDSTNTSVLWEISGNGLNQPSYLLGTIHYRCGENFKMPPTIKAKLKACRAFYAETNYYEPLGYNQYIEYAHWNNKLDSFLKDSLYKVVAQKFFEATNIQLKDYNEIKPFITAQMLFNKKSLHCKKMVSMEKELIDLANKNKIDIYGIESHKEHIELLNDLPDTFQVNYFLWNLFNQNMMEEYIRNATEQFAVNSFFKNSNKNFEDSNYQKNLFDSILLFKRNITWISTIKFRMTIQPTFFAFGAAHLLSSKGLVALLRKEGYTLTPVTY